MIAHIPLNHGSGEQDPRLIVVHAMAEFINMGARTYHASEFLALKGLSAHALITPSGVTIRCRDDLQGAYHAKNHNTDSLGVEFLVPGVHNYASFLSAMKTPYLTTAQYNAGVDLVQEWVRHYDIQRIERHSDIDPERKHDPGDGFPWLQFLEDVR